mmetsp:Transcript_88920/g.108771  ORF Transcript_88920/g.108771 Transcript_88920/m.108771 type:complete len:80 (+) Transcript_88920:24-263(+)
MSFKIKTFFVEENYGDVALSNQFFNPVFGLISSVILIFFIMMLGLVLLLCCTFAYPYYYRAKKKMKQCRRKCMARKRMR